MVRLSLSKKQEQKNDVDLSKTYPVRNPSVAYHFEGKEAQLEIPLKKPPSWLTFFIDSPDKKVLRLDNIGSFVWSKCDGNYSIEDLIKQLSNNFKLNQIEARASLIKFLNDLAKRGLVAFLVKPSDLEKQSSKDDEQKA
ncbi:PqqD family protein [Tardisphaera miroshnichenkoae]